MIDGLKDTVRAAIVDTLSANDRVERVVLFGSRAMETFTIASDVDIALFGENLTPIDQAKLTDQLDRLPIPQRVDLLLHDRVKNQDLIRHVRQHGIEWFNRRTARQDDWHETTLGECVVINTSTYSSKENWPLVNYLDTGNITENRIDTIQEIDVMTQNLPTRARRKVMPGDVVYSTVRPNQRHFGIVDDPPPNFLVSTGFAVLRGLDGVAETDYIYWYLTQDNVVEYLHGIAENSTSAYPSIKPSDLEQLSLKLPPPPEQRRISHILGTLDDKIELNRRMNETLEDMAQAVFKDWFVDFGPVRAKMDGRDAYLPKEIWRLFPDRLVESELGEVPDGWGIRRLGDIGEIVTGKTPSTRNPRFYGDEIPFLKIPDMHGKMFVVDTSTKLSHNGASTQPKKTLPPGSVSVSCIATPGLVVMNHTDVQTNQQINSVIPTDEFSSNYLYWACRQLATDVMLGGSGGSVYSNMNKSTFSDLTTIDVGKKMARAFDRIVGRLHGTILRNELQTRILSRIREALLPGLVSGEVKTQDADKVVKHG